MAILILTVLLIFPHHYYEKVSLELTATYQRYLLKSSTYRARCLIKQLSVVSKRVQIGNSQIPELVSYKFYDRLIYKVLDYHRTFGGPIREVLSELRDSLIADYRTEVDVQKVRSSSKAQMILTSIIIWSFAFFAYEMLNIALDVHNFWPIITLQILGFIFENQVLKLVEKRQLKPFECLLQSLHLFNLLNFSGGSLTSSLKEANLFSSLEQLPNKHQYFHKDFEYLLENWKSFGGSLKSELTIFNEEVKFTFDGQLTDFKRSCSAVQFLTMALFYFPCFFILMGNIMRHISLT